MKNDTEESKLHTMAKIHDLGEMFHGSQNLPAIQKESCTQNKQMSAVGYISDTEEIVKASWSLFQHDGAAAFKLSERSPLPPPLSAKYLPGEHTQILNVRRIRKINLHPVGNDEDTAPESNFDTEHWLNWNGNLDNPNDSEDDCAVDVQSEMEQDSSMKDSESPEQRNESVAPNISVLIQPTWKSKRQAEKVLVTVNAMETRRNKGMKKK
jgi:hypothetical protein